MAVMAGGKSGHCIIDKRAKWIALTHLIADITDWHHARQQHGLPITDRQKCGLQGLAASRDGTKTSARASCCGVWASVINPRATCSANGKPASML